LEVTPLPSSAPRPPGRDLDAIANSSRTRALDLIERTERAVDAKIRQRAATGIAFQVRDIVQAVEDGLPVDYPAPRRGVANRRAMIARMAGEILDGEQLRRSRELRR
jgi:hypothetical protein